MVNISLRKFTCFCTSEVVQDFFHQQYHHISQFFSGEMPRLVNMMSCTKMVGEVCWKVHICPSDHAKALEGSFCLGSLLFMVRSS